MQSANAWQPSNAATLPADELGGKAAHLLRLTDSGLPVPPWMCLSASLVDEMLARLPRSLMDRVAALSALSGAQIQALGNEARAAIATLCFREDDCQGILRGFDDAFGPDALVAVRSSGVDEDGRAHSFAGQLDSFLYVPRGELLARIRDCCASAFSDRVLAYRARQALGADVRLAIVIQQMVDSQVSGVLFTANPATGSRHEMVITAGYGLGEGIVGNLVDVDTYYVDRVSRALRCARATKAARVVWNRAAGAGTTIEPVPRDRAEQEALGQSQVDALVDLGLRIEEVFGCPQDVEWAIDASGAFRITQARPITTLPGGAHRIFDNTNIVEGYPGVTTPLTFSFARAGYEIVFREMARSLGVGEDILREEQSTLSTLLGFLHGRIYYHLPSWYRFYSFVPGFRRNMEAWENALSISNPEIWRRAQERAPVPARRLLRAQARVAGRALWRLATLSRDIRRFGARVERFGAMHARRMEAARSADDLLTLYDDLVAELVHHWAPAVVNDLYAFNFYHLLQELLRDSGIEEPDALCAELLCGISGMDSVEPVRSLLGLVDRIRQSPALLALFTSKAEDRDIWDCLQRERQHAGFRAAAQHHIDRYGDRTVEELKLETLGLAETPAYLVGLCRSYLALDRDVRVQEGREASLRRAAERRLRDRLRRWPGRLALVWLAVQQTRATVRNRENTRLERTRMFGMVKRIFRAVGAHLARAGLIEAPEDIYFLTVEEIQGCVRGTSVTESLRDLVRIRRAEHARNLTLEPPSRLEIHGIAGVGLSAGIGPPASAGGAAAGEDAGNDAPAAVLAGQGCAPGKVRARARVVRDPRGETDIAGEILVAPTTDPGWVFLMTAASGLVVERGNLLSHTAIIGRELGIPTVIGVAGATRKIAEGAHVEVDGGRGTVTILPEVRA